MSTSFDGYLIAGEDRSFSTAPSALVVEILNRAGKAVRTIELSGACLPSRDFSLPIEQRVHKSRPQGSLIANIQVMGPEYPDTTIEGVWAQQLMTVETAGGGAFATIDGVSVLSVRALVETFNELVEAGRALCVRWDTQIRYGVLSSFDPKWRDAGIVDWSMQFMWSSRVPANRKFGTIDLASPPGEKLSWFDQLLAALDTAVKALAWLGDTVFGPVERALKKVAIFNGKLLGVIDAATRLILRPIELATNILTCFEGMLISIAEAMLAIGSAVMTAGSRLASVFSNFDVKVTVPPGYQSKPSNANSDSNAVTPDATGKSTQQTFATATSSDTAPVLSLVTPAPSPGGPVVAPAVSVVDAWGQETTEQDNDTWGFETVPSPDAGVDIDASGTGVPGKTTTQAAGDTSTGLALGSHERQRAVVAEIPIMLRRLQREIIAAREEYRTRISSKLALVGVWVATGRDDLRDVAQRFYGDHRGWRAILDYNRAPNSLLTTGQVVLVPAWSGAEE